MRACLVACALAGLAILGARSAAAQDQCRDVLADGTRSIQSGRGLQQVETARYSRLVRTASSSRKSDSALDVLYEGLDVGLKHSSMRADAQALSRQELSFLSRHSEWEILASSGDPVITEAWVQCMGQDRGGPIVSVSAPDAMNVSIKVALRIRHYGGAPTRTVLLSDLFNAAANPSFEVTANGDCLKKGAAVTPEGCAALLSAKDPAQSLLVAANTDQGAFTYFLPPRLKVLRQSAQLNRAPTGPPAAPIRHRIAVSPNEAITREIAFYLDKDLMDQGYVIDPRAIGLGVVGKEGRARAFTSCGVPELARFDPLVVVWTVRVRNRNKGRSAACLYDVTGTAFRFYAAPI